MEKQVSTADRLKALAGLVYAALSLTGVVLSWLGHVKTHEDYRLVWWVVLGVLLVAGLWLLWSALFAPKSRLLQPERFVILPGARRHLKGREEEITELSELCERHSLVFLEGESGAGKSALVRAGLVDECRRRKHLHPVYVDLSGADWEARLPTLLCGEVWLSLSESDREGLELTCPSPSADLIQLLARTESRLGRTPFLIFDQFDDYQTTYRHRFREGAQANTWITQETLTQINLFWKEVAGLVVPGTIHCLFISRTDNAAGFDAVRFVEARTYRLARVSQNLIAPLLDEITLPESENRPVVEHPEKGWETLKRRLISDLTEDDSVLPVQLSTALQALRRFPVLDVREYERCGGVIGLERFYIEQNLVETSQVSGLTQEQVRKILVNLVDPGRHKSLQIPTSEIAVRIGEDGGTASEISRHRLETALEHLEGKGLVRHRPTEEGREDVWLLQQDFLCRAVLAADQHANRWSRVLQEGASRFTESAGRLQRWKGLLSPWVQAQLAFRRLSGTLRYGSERRFALLSLLRFLPYALLLLVIWGASVQIRIHEDEQEARRILAIFEGRRTTSGEAGQARTFSSAPERVRWQVLEFAFADEKDAKTAERLMPMLLHVHLGLDPTGDLRNRFWTRTVRPAMEKEPGLEVVRLALYAWKEAPGETGDAKALARALGPAVALKADASSSLELLQRDFPPLAPHLDSVSGQSLGDQLLTAMAQERSPSATLAVAKALSLLLPQLRDDQARSAAAHLVGAIVRQKYFDQDFHELVKQALLLRPYLSTEQVSRLAASVARSITDAPYAVSLSSSTGSKEPEIFQQMDTELAGMVVQRLGEAAARETQPTRLIQLTHCFPLLAHAGREELRQNIIQKVVEAMSEEKELYWSGAMAAALGPVASELSPEQAGAATTKLLRALQIEAEGRNEMRMAELGGAIGLFSDWLDEEDARCASILIIGALKSQQMPIPIYMKELIFGLRGAAVRLNGEQRASLLDDMIAGLMRSEHIGLSFWESSLKDMAVLINQEQARNTARRLIEAMEQEKDWERFTRLFVAAVALKSCLDPKLSDALGTRFLHALEEVGSDAKLLWIGRCLADIKDRINSDLLHRCAGIIIGAAEKTNDRVTALRRAETLVGLMDRLEATDARRATEVVVAVMEKSSRRESEFREWLSRLDLPESRFSKEKAGDFSRRIARWLDRVVTEETLSFYDVERNWTIEIPGSQARQNVAALLKGAPDQLLLDILKRPFAVYHAREVVLRAWELKYGQQFDNDLWRFVGWATSDPRTRSLNFLSFPTSQPFEKDAEAK